MGTLIEAIARNREYHQTALSEDNRVESAVTVLGLNNETGFYGNGSIFVYADADNCAAILAKLLPFVGKFTKSFDEENNRIDFTGKYEDRKVIVMVATPSTCTVEAVEEEVIIPAEEERKEIRTRYVLKGDCLPIMAGQQ